MSSFNIEQALGALKTSAVAMEQEALETTLRKVLKEVQIPGPRGEVGATGASGKDAVVPVVKDGVDGKDAPIPEFIVGEVHAGDHGHAAVELKRDKNNTLVFSFTLPAGKQGERGLPSQVAGPAGRPGRDGLDAVPPTEAQIEKIVRKVLDATPEKFRGESVVGAQGPAGERGAQDWTREDIVKVLIETLNTTGILTETMQKILKVRAILRKAAHQADARHIAEIASIVRECDAVLDYTEPAATVTRDDVAKMVSEMLAGKKS
jgi:hypothetical protein